MQNDGLFAHDIQHYYVFCKEHSSNAIRLFFYPQGVHTVVVVSSDEYHSIHKRVADDSCIGQVRHEFKPKNYKNSNRLELKPRLICFFISISVVFK